MSYRKKHIKNKIHGARPKKSIFRKLWFWLAFLVLLLVLTAVYFLVFYPGLQVENIIISGNKKVDSKDLQAIIEEKINNKIFSVVGFEVFSKSIFLVNSEKISQDVLDAFHTIGKVSVIRKFPKALDVEIFERDAAGIFCRGENQCFMIDQNGIIYQEVIPSQMDFHWTIIRQTLSDGNIFAGEKVVAQNIIDSISKIQKDLRDNYKIDLKEAMISSPVRLNITTDKNWQIYFDLGQGYDISAQIKKMDLLLSGGISADSMKNLRYIDVRPKDKAIYCDNKTCGE